MIPPRELIICGGGYSIKEYLPQLKEKLTNKFVISLNKSIEVFPTSTFLSCVDIETFYKTYTSELQKYPLIICRDFEDKSKNKLVNSVFLKTVEKFDRTLKTGVYGSYLAGLFALSLAIYLINEGNVYLLGFDGGSISSDLEDVTNKLDSINAKSKQRCIIQKDDKYYRRYSHFYQGQIEHRGIGKVDFYTKNDKINKVFTPFVNETQCKIYNVSPQSNLIVFSKIDYTTMFAQMNNVVYNQDELRRWVLKRIGEVR